MKTNALSLRLDDKQAQRVKALADKFGVKDVDVIRWGIDALLKYVERHNGRLHLPIDFDVLWEQIQATAPTPDRAHGLNEAPPPYAPKRKRAS